MKDYKDLQRFAEAENFTVTSTVGGNHNAGSKHFRGLAIDVRTRDKTAAECARFIRRAKAIGIVVRDERRKPFAQKVWSGQHIHLEINAQTDAILREFQRSHNLVADGICGAKTLRVLNSIF